jgi:hypothetical protein
MWKTFKNLIHIADENFLTVRYSRVKNLLSPEFAEKGAETAEIVGAKNSGVS